MKSLRTLWVIAVVAMATALVPATHAVAAPMSVPLDLSHWTKTQHTGTGTAEVTADGLKLHTVSYRGNVSMQSNDFFDLTPGGDVRVKWRMGDGTQYQWGGLILMTPGGLSRGSSPYSTHHSYLGSYVVSPGLWYYTRIEVDPAGIFHHRTATGNYDDLGGTYVTGKTTDYTADYPSGLDDSLGQYWWMNDNRGVGVNYYIELGDVVIDPLPEPATMGLLGLGGLAVLKRKNSRHES